MADKILCWLGIISNILGILGFFVSIFTYLKVNSLRLAFRKDVIDSQLLKDIGDFIDQLDRISPGRSTLTKTLANEKFKPIIENVSDLVGSYGFWRKGAINKSLRALSQEYKQDKMTVMKVRFHLKLIHHEISRR